MDWWWNRSQAANRRPILISSSSPSRLCCSATLCPRATGMAVCGGAALPSQHLSHAQGGLAGGLAGQARQRFVSGGREMWWVGCVPRTLAPLSQPFASSSFLKVSSLRMVRLGSDRWKGRASAQHSSKPSKRRDGFTENVAGSRRIRLTRTRLNRLTWSHPSPSPTSSGRWCAATTPSRLDQGCCFGESRVPGRRRSTSSWQPRSWRLVAMC